ncbi:hypothetical protein CEUSTIGMA_g12732.t1 [Chlamydomonas eustigma]|uniref:Uncharacterized protein n=1 Tax=Chlamydomonas eustigma TaxID=1157962 RepID=A0A250XQI1_9CHLO|nr:hypothetical protein CEUSTIGMA_g12732.t1 [Chlamydomonas eustigma]|eukprot:GAX85315.1 hypothetical protein CEUSTIGMA_g12732.t1 [Chlamydomonas eustigma]
MSKSLSEKTNLSRKLSRSSSNLTSPNSHSRIVSISGDIKAQAEAEWQAWELRGDISEGILPKFRMREFLQQLHMSHEDIEAAMLHHLTLSETDAGLTKEQVLALSTMSHGSPDLTGPSSSQSSLFSRAPLKKVLSKNRPYLGTGHLVYDDTVLDYIRKLEEHRKKCENERRYPEAKAAARRLADLKTAQVERMRQELVAVQTRELAEIQRVYEEESNTFNAVWAGRIADYDAAAASAAENLRHVHEQQALHFQQELTQKRVLPRPTREFLEGKKIEESLVKTKEYARAAKMQQVTDQMFLAQLEQATMAAEVEQRLKMSKLVSKQGLEMEAQLCRGVRGRHEMELKRMTETDRRTQRYKNVVSELESLHRLEVVSLENFLEGQVMAGKAVPLKDGFRRKREQLLCTLF